MNTFAYQVIYPCLLPQTAPTEPDWLDMEWGGPYPEEEGDAPIALCGSWDCSGDCDACFRAELKLRGITMVAIQGPINRDGIPLGFLLMAA